MEREALLTSLVHRVEKEKEVVGKELEELKANHTEVVSVRIKSVSSSSFFSLLLPLIFALAISFSKLCNHFRGYSLSHPSSLFTLSHSFSLSHTLSVPSFCLLLKPFQRNLRP